MSGSIRPPTPATVHLSVDGRTPRVTLDVTWIVQGELYAVYRDNAEHRIHAGEIHATTLDGDEIPLTEGEESRHFPSRYRKGLYSAARAWGHKLVDLDHVDPEKPGRFERRPEVLGARRDKLMRWQDATQQLINYHLALIHETRTWAEHARDSQTHSGAYTLVSKLEPLKFRPFYPLTARIMNDLHAGNLESILAVCSVLLARHDLEGVMNPISDAMERVGRYKEDSSVTIGKIFPNNARQELAETMKSALTTLRTNGTEAKLDLTRSIRTLEAACDELQVGTLRNTKTILGNALSELDVAFRL